jgi:hypothetical protein
MGRLRSWFSISTLGFTNLRLVALKGAGHNHAKFLVQTCPVVGEHRAMAFITSLTWRQLGIVVLQSTESAARRLPPRCSATCLRALSR